MPVYKALRRKRLSKDVLVSCSIKPLKKMTAMGKETYKKWEDEHSQPEQTLRRMYAVFLCIEAKVQTAEEGMRYIF